MRKYVWALCATAILLAACSTENNSNKSVSESTIDSSIQVDESTHTGSITYRVRVRSVEDGLLTVVVDNEGDESDQQTFVSGDLFSLSFDGLKLVTKSGDGYALDAIDEGQLLDVTLSEKTIMTMSIPPMVSGNSIESIVVVGK